MAMITVVKLKKNDWPEDEAPFQIEESLLEYKEGVLDNENEYTTWREWRLEGKIVKRSAHVTLKKFPPHGKGEAASFG
jgi:hypothetical protein